MRCWASPDGARLSGEFDPERALAHVESLTAGIGPRLAGSLADGRARAYARAELAKRATVREQGFPILTGEVDAYGLALTAPRETPIACAPFVMSGPGEVEGEILWAGPGEAPEAARGKVLFWRIGARDEILERYRLMAALGPLAIVVVWNRPGPLPKYQRIAEARGREGPTPPSLAIRYEEGLLIEREGARRARVSILGAVREGETGNVIGEIGGAAADRRVIVIGAHIDTAPATPGAIDNAAGVACMLELARVWSTRAPRHAMRFVAWGAEKAGMVGAKHYLAGLSQAELDRQALCICMDGFGAYDGAPVCYATGCESLTRLTGEACADPETDVALRQGFYGSDSEMFVRRGVPSLTFGQEGESVAVLHTAQDQLSRIDPRQLGRTGRAVDLVLQALDRAPKWPIAARVSEVARAEADAQLRRMGWV